MSVSWWKKLVQNLDRADMYGKIIGFPQMLNEALDVCPKSGFSFKGAIDNVVGCGMGGSAIGLEITKNWLLSDLKVPFEVVRDYSLPSYVSKKTLLYVASYSGDTEETIHCLRQGLRSKANVFTVSSGGEIKDISADSGVKHLTIPLGYPPRAAFPFLFTPLVWLLTRSRIAPVERLSELEESVPYVERAIRKSSIEVEEEENEAKSLAKAIGDRFPIIYGHGVMGAVALRFKQQLNENAKGFASQNVFPELNHNEFEGVRYLPMNKPLVILLRYREEPSEIARKISVTKKMLAESYSDTIEMWGEGDTEISQALSLIVKLDVTSFYLSLIRGIDPSPTPKISKLKSTLAERE